MTDIMEVANDLATYLSDGSIAFTEDALQAFADHYRKEGAEEANKTIEGLHAQLTADDKQIVAMHKTIEELRRKLTEQQAVAAHDIEKLVGLGWTPCECDICGSTMASFKAIPKLADAIASAKQEGYEQGKQAGRDEVLRELSEQEPASHLYIYRHPMNGSKTFGSHELKGSWEYELLETKALIIRPSVVPKQ